MRDGWIRKIRKRKVNNSFFSYRLLTKTQKCRCNSGNSKESRYLAEVDISG